MNGYFIQVRYRRAGASTKDRVLTVSDAGLARLERSALLAFGVLLFFLAPLAMAALTMPEGARNERIAYQNFVGDWQD